MAWGFECDQSGTSLGAHGGSLIILPCSEWIMRPAVARPVVCSHPDSHHPGLPRRHPAAEGGPRGLLHEHAEHRTASPEASASQAVRPGRVAGVGSPGFDPSTGSRRRKGAHALCLEILQKRKMWRANTRCLFQKEGKSAGSVLANVFQDLTFKNSFVLCIANWKLFGFMDKIC